MTGRCCVFQPFDRGAYDKRYDDTLAPAIKAADLEPYRVDRDPGVVIPIDALHDQIQSAVICLADVTTQNPNVMYELGFAVASGKDVVIICSAQSAGRFPFDIQHRGIIQYASDSASDFERLKNEVTNKIRALLKKQAATRNIAAASPVKSTEGLQPNEVAALAFVMADSESSSIGVSTYNVREDMEKAGYNRVATQLALLRLTRLRFVEPFEDDYQGEAYVRYRLLTTGEDWLLSNQQLLELHVSEKPAPPRPARNTETQFADDDVPF